MNRLISHILENKKTLYWAILGLAGLIGIVYSLSTNTIWAFSAIVTLPLAFMLLVAILERPSTMLYVLFTANYFIMGISRYAPIEGISVFIDIMMVIMVLILFIHSALSQNIHWRDAFNVLTVVSFIWTVYCILEIMNPTGMIELWVRSRALMYYGLITAICASVVIQEFKHLKFLINLYAAFTIIAILKALMQKFFGFDAFEMDWLESDPASYGTHILITGVIRYFSIFTDAGNFGSNMGAAATIFILMSFFVKQKKTKIVYGMIGLGSLLAMFMSGTRGAMIVPMGGLALYVIVSKNYKAIFFGGLTLAVLYVFFAFTYIGEGNMMISRMRTAFRPGKDASFVVRQLNQAKLAEYLKDRPFGEGLGLSGSESLKYTVRLTTKIPNDSWYVKVWVETGVVGITIYSIGLILVLLKCIHTLMFRVKERELFGIMASLLCGVFGLMLSAYGNPFFGQFPTLIMVYMYLAAILKTPKLEQSFIDYTNQKKVTTV